MNFACPVPKLISATSHDQVTLQLGRQRWRTRGRIKSDDTQSWEGEDMVFLPHTRHNFEIKVRICFIDGKMGLLQLRASSYCIFTCKLRTSHVRELPGITDVFQSFNSEGSAGRRWRFLCLFSLLTQTCRVGSSITTTVKRKQTFRGIEICFHVD